VKRKHVAFLLLSAAGVTLAAFYATLGRAGPITGGVVVSVAVATLAGGWGAALLLPDRYRRWGVRYMAIITLPVVAIAFVLFRAVARMEYPG
jgi:hypothetical protein